MMLEFRHPLPVVTPLGEGFAIYVTDGGSMANDIWTVVLDNAEIRHFTTEQLTYVDNGTLGIKAEPATKPITHRDAGRISPSPLCGAPFHVSDSLAMDDDCSLPVDCVLCLRIMAKSKLSSLLIVRDRK